MSQFQSWSGAQALGVATVTPAVAAEGEGTGLSICEGGDVAKGGISMAIAIAPVLRGGDAPLLLLRRGVLRGGDTPSLVVVGGLHAPVLQVSCEEGRLLSSIEVSFKEGTLKYVL